MTETVENNIINGAKLSLAIRDADSFCEYVLKDDKGQKVTQASIHREMNEHIDECRRRGVRCGILAPWRHGKTEQIAIARTLQFLGENPNNRIQIVTNTDANSVSRVDSISRYIEHDEDYHEVYPNIAPGEKESWSKHKLIVQRETKIKDGSVEAWGITTSGTGSGCDYLIVDDPVDLRNAILNPAMRKTVKDSFYNVWSTRLEPNGFMIYIATIWHEDDLTSELLKNPEYYFLVMKISQDFSCIECESPFKGKYTIPLWDKWPKEKLIARHNEIGSRAFNRGYRQEALSDEDRTFNYYLNIFKKGIKISDVVRRDWPRVGGMDPFGQWVVIFTLALSPEGRRYPVEIRRGKWDPKVAVMELIDSYRMHKHQIICVENNAAQSAIRQWALEKGSAGMPLVPFTTGSQKAHPELGLPGMNVEFENGSWVVADPEHGLDCQCAWCIWKMELRTHPVSTTADTVMASWLAREAARALMAGVCQPQAEEVVTMEDVGLERVKIGDY